MSRKRLMLNCVFILLIVLLGIPWLILYFKGHKISPLQESIFSGLAIVAAAFILSWATELAQLEIPRGFAFAILALIAVLPEYAVDMVYSWMAGKSPEYLHYPAANMTGSNRLLIGIGWSAVVFFYWLASKKTEIILKKENRLELTFLGIATLYSFLLPIKGNISLLDSVVLISLFIFYLRGALKGEVEEPHLIGPAALIACCSPFKRRFLNVLMFLSAGFLIFIAAEPFAKSLLETGKILGIEEFLLVQWIAPLASEAPEMIVAILFTLQQKPLAGLQTVLSSKINQWSLLVGCIPIVYSLSGRSFAPLPLDARQAEEILLTAAQSLLGLTFLINLRFSLREAGLLFLLFAVQLIFPDRVFRYLFSFFYILLALSLLIGKKSVRSNLLALFIRPKTEK